MVDPFSDHRRPDAERIVFLGDSLVRQGDWSAWFPELDVVNLGVDGETTESLLVRLDSIADSQPDTVALLIGTNDFAARLSVEHVVRNIENILVHLRKSLPGARMLVQSILPRAVEFAERIRDANRHLRQFAATVPAQYLDLWPALAEDSGELNHLFCQDRLHLNETGYEAWLRELRPALERLRDMPPMSRPIPIVSTDDFARPR